MLYWLAGLSGQVSVLNVFRYITFRAGGATLTALAFVLLFGPNIIDLLRARQGKGQPIRTDGPQSHLITKIGTPTMGGLMILFGVMVAVLLWANLTNPYVWVVLGVVVFVVRGWERERVNRGQECAGHGGGWLVGCCFVVGVARWSSC